MKFKTNFAETTWRFANGNGRSSTWVTWKGWAAINPLFNLFFFIENNINFFTYLTTFLANYVHAKHFKVIQYLGNLIWFTHVPKTELPRTKIRVLEFLFWFDFDSSKQREERLTSRTGVTWSRDTWFCRNVVSSMIVYMGYLLYSLFVLL